jgi:CheY-like chemotaxis protein
VSAPQIPIAEDSELDFFLIESILQDCPNPPGIQRAVNGEEALELMRRAQHSGLHDRPDLVLLDMNLPGRRAGSSGVHQILGARLRYSGRYP